jgi:endonuclease YncB( thermonuclease family)
MAGDRRALAVLHALSCAGGFILAASALTACSFSEEETFIVGKVVQVTDGDTLTLLVDGGQGDVRLAGIDAPERAQPFGKRSQHSLSVLCAGKDARVKFVGIDGHGPVVGRVWCSGVDVNAEQVRLGMASVYDHVTDRNLYSLQEAARNARRGLWSAGQAPRIVEIENSPA